MRKCHSKENFQVFPSRPWNVTSSAPKESPRLARHLDTSGTAASVCPVQRPDLITGFCYPACLFGSHIFCFCFLLTISTSGVSSQFCFSLLRCRGGRMPGLSSEISLTALSFHSAFKNVCFLSGLTAIMWVSPDR